MTRFDMVSNTFKENNSTIKKRTFLFMVLSANYLSISITA